MPLPHRIYLCSPLALFSLRPTFTSAISKQEASHSLVLRLAHSTITYSHTDATEHNGLSANTEHFVIVLSRTVLHEFFRWAFFFLLPFPSLWCSVLTVKAIVAGSFNCSQRTHHSSSKLWPQGQVFEANQEAVRCNDALVTLEGSPCWIWRLEWEGYHRHFNWFSLRNRPPRYWTILLWIPINTEKSTSTPCFVLYCNKVSGQK